MLRSIALTTPAPPPLDVRTAAAHLHVSEADENATLERLIRMAMEEAEDWTNRKLQPAKFSLYLDAPVRDAYGRPVRDVVLPWVPLVSVEAVAWRASDQTPMTLDLGTDYAVDLGGDNTPGRISLLKGWPAVDVTRPGGFRVDYTCGYATRDAIPSKIVQGMLMRIGDFFQNRESLAVSGVLSEIPKTVWDLYSLAQAGTT